jgi:hypothetical protein
MSSNLQQAIFMQRNRESKQSAASNIQQKISSSTVSAKAVAAFQNT